MQRLVATIATGAVLAACSARIEGPARPVDDPAILPAPGIGSEPGSRLLVLTDDGAIVTTERDGSGRQVLRAPGDIDVEATQPVWSPDGRLVAWVETSTGGPAGASVLVTSRPDGTGRTEVRVDAGMFFLSWDPTSSRLAYLGSYRESIGMGVAERADAGGLVARTLGVGSPFYVSWAPTGDRLLIHVGEETLGRVDLEGRLESLGDRPGVFHAPVWLPDGRLVYAEGRGERQTLVVRDGSRTTPLVRFGGAIEFVVSPTGDRIAYRVDAGGRPGTVSVVRIRTGRTEPLRLVATAFHWSPDGRRLLLMAPEREGDPTAHRWHVWDGEGTAPIGPPFLPSPTYLRDYVPFFGQYAQAMTLWSPDAGAFAFPGLIGDRAGVWVQAVHEDEPTLAVEDGSVVAWSPVAR
jgi:Tol biopolymer transport system component